MGKQWSPRLRRPDRARRVPAAPSPVVLPPSAEVVTAARWPDLARVTTRIAVLTANGEARAPAELRTLRRHVPVFDHGRFSDAGPCPSPVQCEHEERPLVCLTCRDCYGDPVVAPCDDLVDCAARMGVSLPID